MEAWRTTWREGIAPQLSPEALRALKTALETDDPRLLQGATTTPPPLQCVQYWPVEAACPIAFAGWQGEGLLTVAQVEEFFARVCFEIDTRVGIPAGCRWFIDWADDTPRNEMRRELLAEVELALNEVES